MLDMLDYSLASAAFAFSHVSRTRCFNQGIIEMACCVAEIVDFKLGDDFRRKVREEPVNDGGALNAALRMRDENYFLGGGSSESGTKLCAA